MLVDFHQIALKSEKMKSELTTNAGNKLLSGSDIQNELTFSLFHCFFHFFDNFSQKFDKNIGNSRKNHNF